MHSHPVVAHGADCKPCNWSEMRTQNDVSDPDFLLFFRAVVMPNFDFARWEMRRGLVKRRVEWRRVVGRPMASIVSALSSVVAKWTSDRSLRFLHPL